MKSDAKQRYCFLAGLKQVNRCICDRSFRSMYWEKGICLVLIYSCGLSSSSFQYYAHRYRICSWLAPEPTNINYHFGEDFEDAINILDVPAGPRGHSVTKCSYKKYSLRNFTSVWYLQIQLKLLFITHLCHIITGVNDHRTEINGFGHTSKRLDRRKQWNHVTKRTKQQHCVFTATDRHRKTETMNLCH